MKKLFCITLATVLMCMSGVTAFAKSSDIEVLDSEQLENAVILADYETEDYTVKAFETNEEYVVVTYYEDFYEICRRQIDSFVITSEQYDYNGNLITSDVCDYSNFEDTTSGNQEISEPNPYAVGEYQHTISNYEYDIDGGASGRYEIWTCTRRSDEKVRPVHDTTSALFERLDHWRTLVNDINDYEKDLGLTAGEAAVGTAIELYFFKSPTAALTFLLGLGDVVEIFEDFDQTIVQADKVFNRI